MQKGDKAYNFLLIRTVILHPSQVPTLITPSPPLPSLPLLSLSSPPLPSPPLLSPPLPSSPSPPLLSPPLPSPPLLSSPLPFPHLPFLAVDSGSGLSNPVNSGELQARLEAFQEYQETAEPQTEREPYCDLRTAETAAPHLHRSVSTPSMVSVGEEQVPESGEWGGWGGLGEWLGWSWGGVGVVLGWSWGVVGVVLGWSWGVVEVVLGWSWGVVGVVLGSG